MNGGRFDFDDGGTYCGGWEEGKAHGHGVCTGPDSQGEYAGAWHYGFEVSGIYIWPSGSTYSGQWQNGKRHGLGVEQRGRWIYKGEWTQGFKGRYGRREAVNSGAHYLGTWSSGLHDGYGTEVYADGGSYRGQWFRGMRHGYGIRTSATHESAAKHRSRSNTHTSLTSLRSYCDDDNGGGADVPRSARDKKSAERQEMRGGFVLKARCAAPARRRRSLSERSLAVKRSILSNLRIKKQHSTGDIHQRVTSTGGSLRSSGSTISCASDDSGGDHRHHHHNLHDYDMTEEDKIEPSTIEVYKGEWKNDMRSGCGVCERSDGLRYAGEWLDNKKHGYGVTYFKDGTKEEGRYKNNVLVCSIRRKGIFFVRTSKVRDRVEANVEGARRAAELAAQRVDIALSRTMTAQERADAADEAAQRAKDDSDTARIYCAQFDPSFRQPGIDHIRQSRNRAGILQSSVYANHVSFESATSAGGLPPPPLQHYASQHHLFGGGGGGVAQQQSMSARSHPHHQQLPPHSYHQQQAAFFAQQQQQQQQQQQNHKPPQPQSAQQIMGNSTAAVFAQQQAAALNNPNLLLSSGQTPPQGSNSGTYFEGRPNNNAPTTLQQQQHQQSSHDPDATSTSGLFLQHQHSNDSMLNTAHNSQNAATVLPDRAIHSTTSHQNILMSNDSSAAGAIKEHANYAGSEAGASTSKLVGNSVGNKHHHQLQHQPQSTPTRPSGANRLGMRNRPDRCSTMSLSDDHFDQYTMKRLSGGPETAGDGTRTIFEEGGVSGMEPRLRRNRPSLIRQFEVNEANLNRRSTLASARDRIDPTVVTPLVDHRLAGATEIGGEHGSLPNLDELTGQEVLLKREEAARLASERRQEAQRQLEEAQRLHSNPLRYLYHPALRNWLAKWKVPLLLLVGNIVLLYYLMHLLTVERDQQRAHHHHHYNHHQHSNNKAEQQLEPPVD